MTDNSPITYKDSGVDIYAGDELVRRIKILAEPTITSNVISGIGGFGAMFKMSKTYKEPILVSGSDGVGTKLKLAVDYNMHDTIGIDLVAMSVNDILVQGAKPAFFMDYFACGKLDLDIATSVLNGIVQGCILSDCSLIGGETAEMPDIYKTGEYDLAGFALGIVEQSKILGAHKVNPGNIILGLASSGLHSNGYSLVRKCIERDKNPPKTLDSKEFKLALMEPTRIYVKNILSVINEFPDETPNINAMAHITGGGLIENIPRVLPDHLCANLDSDTFPKSELYSWIQNTANIDNTEMYRTFNCGIGMVLFIEKKVANEVISLLEFLGETTFNIGTVDYAYRPGEKLHIC